MRSPRMGPRAVTTTVARAVTRARTARVRVVSATTTIHAQNHCGAGTCFFTIYEPATTPCSDNNVCTQGDHCSGASGTCVSGPTIPNCCTSAADCDDNNACTTDTCVSGTCEHSPVTCGPSPNACQDNVCNPVSGQCELVNDNTNTCTDNNACTTGTCVNGTCQSSAAVTCGPSPNASATR